MADDHERATRYLDQAEELRVAAARMTSELARTTLLEIADEYVRLAGAAAAGPEEPLDASIRHDDGAKSAHQAHSSGPGRSATRRSR